LEMLYDMTSFLIQDQPLQSLNLEYRGNRIEQCVFIAFSPM